MTTTARIAAGTTVVSPEGTEWIVTKGRNADFVYITTPAQWAKGVRKCLADIPVAAFAATWTVR